MKQKSIFKIAAIALAVTITLPVLIMTEYALAQAPVDGISQNTKNKHPVGMMGLSHGAQMGGMQEMMDILELDANQKIMIQKIRKLYQPQMREYMNAMLEGRKTLLATVEGGIDEYLISEQANAQGKRLADLIILRGQIRQQVYTVLTPKQQQLFSETLKKRIM